MPVADSEELAAPRVFGEAALVATQQCCAATIRATRHCIGGVLSRSDFKQALLLHPPPPKLLFGLCREVQTEALLQNRLARTTTFSGARKDFLALLCSGAQHVFLAPGETILRRGEPCGLGASFCYTVLAGQAEIGGEVGVFVDTLQCGHVFGEAGAFGLADRRTQMIRAKAGEEEGLLQCAALSGTSIQAACSRFPPERERLAELFRRREEENRRGLEKRQAWLQDHVGPLLSRINFFATRPPEFQAVVTSRVRVRNYDALAAVFETGHAADSMFLIVDGTAELQAKHGEVIAAVGRGASFGEAAVLGLLGVRTATLRARSACCLAELTVEALQSALAQPSFAAVKLSFGHLVRDRREQVKLGLPMCALPLHITADDICARLVALQAARLVLPPRAVWEPMPDSCPNGPHFGVLVSGRAVVEMGAARRWVARLKAGSFVPEGLIADCGAVVRAEVASEAYRVRQSDFLLATGTAAESRHWSGSQPPMQDWYGRCRLLEREARARLAASFDVARGADEALSQPPVATDLRPTVSSPPRPARTLARSLGDLRRPCPPSETAAEALSNSGNAAVPDVLSHFGKGLGKLLPSQARRPRQCPLTDTVLQKVQGRRAPPKLDCPSLRAVGAPHEGLAWQDPDEGLDTGSALHKGAAAEVAEPVGPRGQQLGPLAPARGRASRPGSRGGCDLSRSLGTLPLLGAGSRPGTSGGQTRAFRDETGCGPGDLLMWSLPQAQLKQLASK